MTFVHAATFSFLTFSGSLQVPPGYYSPGVLLTKKKRKERKKESKREKEIVSLTSSFSFFFLFLLRLLLSSSSFFLLNADGMNCLFACTPGAYCPSYLANEIFTITSGMEKFPTFLLLQLLAFSHKTIIITKRQ